MGTSTSSSIIASAVPAPFISSLDDEVAKARREQMIFLAKERLLLLDTERIKAERDMLKARADEEAAIKSIDAERQRWPDPVMWDKNLIATWRLHHQTFALQCSRLQQIAHNASLLTARKALVDQHRVVVMMAGVHKEMSQDAASDSKSLTATLKELNTSTRDLEKQMSRLNESLEQQQGAMSRMGRSAETGHSAASALDLLSPQEMDTLATRMKLPMVQTAPVVIPVPSAPIQSAESSTPRPPPTAPLISNAEYDGVASKASLKKPVKRTPLAEGSV